MKLSDITINGVAKTAALADKTRRDGPERRTGRVERVIRTLIAKQLNDWRRADMTTETLCGAAFGEGPWTNEQRVSVLRAMHRIMATDPGWTVTVNCYRHSLQFSLRPPTSGPQEKSGLSGSAATGESDRRRSSPQKTPEHALQIEIVKVKAAAEPTQRLTPSPSQGA